MALQIAVIQFLAFATGTVAMAWVGVTDAKMAAGLLIGCIAGMVLSRIQTK